MSGGWHEARYYVAVDRPEFTFDLTEYRNNTGSQMLFIGLHVHKWSKSVLKEMLHTFKLFRECVTCPLFATAEVEDPKWVNFVRFFGFKPLQEVICENGEHRRLFINLKDNSSVVLETNTEYPDGGVVSDEPLGSSG